MDKTLIVALIGGGAVIITSFITAYLTSKYNLKKDERKWKSELSLKIAELNFDNPDKVYQIEKQFAIALIIAESHEKRIRKFIIPNNRIQIGRYESSDIVLGHPNISNEHCAIFSDEKRVFIEDLFSTHGTYLNGHKIIKKEELKDNDEIQIQDTTIKFKKL